jgi:uncharacterized membrane-anchored protein YhcB (DUF1043 family)
MANFLQATILLLLLLAVIAVMVWLFLENRKFKLEQQNLKKDLEKVNRDLAGLCSAAVNVDTRLTKNSSVLLGMVKDLEEILEPVAETSKTETSEPQPYQDIIQVVKQGVEPEELVHQFGVSFDEAALLIRLHGIEKMKT